MPPNTLLMLAFYSGFLSKTREGSVPVERKEYSVGKKRSGT